MKLLKITYLLPLLMLAFMAACSTDDINDKNDAAESSETSVTFNLGTTRGSLQPAVNDDELITSYVIVVAKEGTIVRVLTASGLPAAEMHAVKAQLPSGDYKVYAFANIPFANEGDWLYGKFTEGAAMPDLSTMYYGAEDFKNGFTGSIPMSSVNGMDLTILPSKGNETYGIEVIRMLAKVEFLFTNSSEDPITINKIGLGPLTKSGASGECIPLMTYNDAMALSFASDVTTEDFVYTLPTATTLAAGTSTPKSVSFYVIESTPNTLSNAFSLSFNVQQGSLPEDTRYALLDKTQVETPGTNLDGDNDRSPFIRRNDWLRIPIDLGSYELKLEARSYPPIGGYPEVDVTQSEDGHYVNFTLPGTFSIRPAIRQYGTTDWIYLSDATKVASYSFTVDTTSEGMTDIFSKKPAKKGSEITGAIKPSAQGTALVTLTVTLKLPGDKTRILTKKMYLTAAL